MPFRQRRKRGQDPSRSRVFPLGRKNSMTEIIELLVETFPSAGCPIIASGALFWYIIDQRKMHKAEMDELRKVIEENTVVLASLRQVIEDKVA